MRSAASRVQLNETKKTCGSSKLNDAWFSVPATPHLDNGTLHRLVVACSEHLRIVQAIGTWRIPRAAEIFAVRFHNSLTWSAHSVNAFGTLDCESAQLQVLSGAVEAKAG